MDRETFKKLTKAFEIKMAIIAVIGSGAILLGTKNIFNALMFLSGIVVTSLIMVYLNRPKLDKKGGNEDNDTEQ